MDILFLFLAVPFVLHAVGNVYVNHFAAGQPDPYQSAVDEILDCFEP